MSHAPVAGVKAVAIRTYTQITAVYQGLWDKLLRLQSTLQTSFILLKIFLINRRDESIHGPASILFRGYNGPTFSYPRIANFKNTWSFASSHTIPRLGASAQDQLLVLFIHRPCRTCLFVSQYVFSPK
jgi:hypothetical protein